MNVLIIVLSYLFFWLPFFWVSLVLEARSPGLGEMLVTLVLMLPVAIALQLGGRELLDAEALWWRPLRRYLPAPKPQPASLWEEDALESEALEHMGSYRVSRSLLAILPATLLWNVSLPLLALSASTLFWQGFTAAWLVLFPALAYLGSRGIAGYVEGRQLGRPWHSAWTQVRFPLLIGTLTLAFVAGYLGICAVLPIGFGRSGRNVNGIFALGLYSGAWVLFAAVLRQIGRWRRGPA